MNPFPERFSVLVLDNAIIHKGQRLRDLCQEKGVKLEFLPPYSPDYNPVSNKTLIISIYYLILIKSYLYRLSKPFFILRIIYAKIGNEQSQ